MNFSVNKLKTPKTARVFVAGNTQNPKKIWILCHGYGQLANYFLEKFSALDNGKNLLIAPEGLNRFYTKGFNGRVGASWMSKEERLDEIEDYITWLKLVYESYVPANTTAKIIVLGFSQGGATVCRFVEQAKVKIDFLVLYASTFPADVVPNVNLMRYISQAVLFVIGNQDEFINEEEKQKQIETLGIGKNNLELMEFVGRHDIYEAVLLDIEKRIGGE